MPTTTRKVAASARFSAKKRRKIFPPVARRHSPAVRPLRPHPTQPTRKERVFSAMRRTVFLLLLVTAGAGLTVFAAQPKRTKPPADAVQDAQQTRDVEAKRPEQKLSQHDK